MCFLSRFIARIYKKKCIKKVKKTVLLRQYFNAKISHKNKKKLKGGVKNKEDIDLCSLIQKIAKEILEKNIKKCRLKNFGVGHERAWNRIEKFYVSNRIESNHMPLEIQL